MTLWPKLPQASSRPRRSSAAERINRRSRRVPARNHRPEPQETGEAGPATEPQARMRSRRSDCDNAAVRRAPEGWRVRLHRALLQCATAALDDRLSKPYGVRAQGRVRLSRCHPNRVQASALGTCDREKGDRKARCLRFRLWLSRRRRRD